MYRFFTLIVCCLPFILSAQDSPALLKVAKIPLNNTLTYYQFFHEKGETYSLLIREQHDVGKNPVLRYYQLNQALEIQNQGFFPLSNNAEVILAKENRKNIFILLKKEEINHEIVILNKSTSEFEVSKIKVPEKLKITHFLATEEALFIGGKTKGKTTAYKAAVGSKKLQILFHHIKQTSKISSLQYHPITESVSFLMEISHGNYTTSYYINHYDEDGSFLYNAKLNVPINYRISNAKLTVINKKSCMLVGTYSHAIMAKENVMGLFSIKLREKEVVSKHFYNFGKIENYFTYLSDKRSQKLIKRIDKAASKSKPVKTGINIVLETPEINNGNILLKGSSFFKLKNTDKSYSFEYLNTFLACFDTNGRLTSNNSITYPNTRLTTSSPFLLTEASIIHGDVFFIQKQNHIYRSKFAHRGKYHSNIQHTYLNDGFFNLNYKNIFYDQQIVLKSNGLLLYYGVVEKTPLRDLTNGQLYFFIENIEAVPSQLLSKGAN